MLDDIHDMYVYFLCVVFQYSKYIQRWSIINHLKNCIGRHNKARIVMTFWSTVGENIELCFTHGIPFD